jgi:hypothetical protein
VRSAKRASIVAVVLLTLPQISLAETTSFQFARTINRGWTLEAETELVWSRSNDTGLPSISSIICRGQGEQVNFTMNGSGEIGGLSINFLGDPEKDGDRSQITLIGDRLWLYIDGQRWEYAKIAARSLLTNVAYPPTEGDILLLWTGHSAVRADEGKPWLHISRIYEKLIAAKSVSWSYKSRNWKDVDQSISENRLPVGWQAKRYKINAAGLGSAVDWCAQQVRSDMAYKLPPQLSDRVIR